MRVEHSVKPAIWIVTSTRAEERHAGAATIVRGGEVMTTTASVKKLLLTPVEAAEQLAVSRTKVYELMAAGLLRSIRIGRSRRVPVDALGDFIDLMGSQ